MKKLFFIILITIAATWFVANYLNYVKEKNEPPTQDTIEQQFVDNNDELQAELNKYKEKVQKEELRKIELKKLQNPEIINTELSKVGKLLIYQGKMQYSDIMVESKWWYKKELNLELHYNFGIAIEVYKIVVSRFIDKTVVLQIPVNEIRLEYIELNSDESKHNSERSWWASEYSPAEMDQIYEKAQSDMKYRVENDKGIYQEALVSLKDCLRELLGKVGYEEVVFEEI
jgi:hypothetical protein